MHGGCFSSMTSKILTVRSKCSGVRVAGVVCPRTYFYYVHTYPTLVFSEAASASASAEPKPRWILHGKSVRISVFTQKKYRGS